MGTTSTRGGPGGPPLRIALVAPPFVAVPPPAYGGTERVVAALVDGLRERGHDVTLFAAGDSRAACRLVATVPVSLWVTGFDGDPVAAERRALADAAAMRDQFDVVHAHLDPRAVLAERWRDGPPIVATMHGPLDVPGVREAMCALGQESAVSRPALVALSRSQAAGAPGARWAAVVPNGLPFGTVPAGVERTADFCFVGRMDPEKGLLEAIEIARRAGRRLRVAARIGSSPMQRAHFERTVRPALAAAHVRYLGELSNADRDRLFVASAATIMPIQWPEPFGLVAIESLAMGTPVLAHARGALPEIVRHGLDGYLGATPEDLVTRAPAVDALPRERIRRDAIARFGADRMVERYEALYRALVGGAGEPERVGTVAS